MNEGWINVYENPPGSNAVPCSCIWPTKEIADRRRLEEHFVACIKVQWDAETTAPTQSGESDEL
jgi:hypothetical protein